MNDSNEDENENENEVENKKNSSEEGEEEEEEETKEKEVPKKTYKDYLIKLLSDPPKKPINLPKHNNTTSLKLIAKPKFPYHETARSQLFKNHNLNNKNNQMVKSDFQIHFNKANNNKAILKKNTFRAKLAKLYGYNEQFENETKQVKRNKKNTNIENYQNKILKLSSHMNLSRDNMATLYSNLNTIKRTSENVKPLPPINYPALITHSCLQSERKGKTKKSFGLFSQKKFNEMDDYEKELYGINLSKHKKNTFSNDKDKRIMKLHEILPEYLIQALYNKNPKRNDTDN